MFKTMQINSSASFCILTNALYIPVIRCPYCQSTDTSKISAVGRVVSTGLFELGSKKIGKQWHCNKCGSDF